MAFKELLNKPAAESDLLKQIARHLQSQYSAYQNACYFMKLEKLTDQTSQIIWVKTFSDMYDLGDFFYDTVYERACILVKFEEGRYELLTHGFHLFDRFKIWPDKTEGHRTSEVTGNREHAKMIPREILENAFGEIRGAVSTAKRNKAV